LAEALIYLERPRQAHEAKGTKESKGQGFDFYLTTLFVVSIIFPSEEKKPGPAFTKN
jgi:hypothetical protein